MNYVKGFLCVEAIVCIVNGIKVNMQGSLSLGRDVIDTLSHYFGQNILSGRRSLNPAPIEDPITLAVREAQICKDLKFCDNTLKHFINEYVIILAKAVASILSNLNIEFNEQEYGEQLKQVLQHIRIVLDDANMKVETDTEAYYWTHTIKRINAKFQQMSRFFNTKTYDNADYNNATGAEMRYKIVIATAFIERKYLLKLCSEYSLCSKAHHCTHALNKLLVHFKTMPEDRIRMFIKYFYEALFNSQFYSILSTSTANDFQIILNDMIYANDTPTRDIMVSVQKTVEARLDMIKMNKVFVVEHDILIAHVILSDIDHMFNNRTDPFMMFQNKFYDWLASDVQIDISVRAVLSDVSKQIWLFEDDLVRKLIDEVIVFLEMTVTVKDK